MKPCLSYAVLLLGLLGFCPVTQSQAETLPGYTLRWLGTAAWQLDYAGQTILFDPFLSRQSGRPNQTAIDHALHTAAITQVSAIFISHSHYDHAGDVPSLVASFPAATVYATAATCQLLRSAQPNAHCVAIAPQTYTLGALRIRALPSQHAVLDEPMTDADAAAAECWMFHMTGPSIDLLFQGTANFAASSLPGLHAKVAILAPVHAERIPHYHEAFINAVDPEVILLNHFERFLLPYTRGVIPLQTPAELAGFIGQAKTTGGKQRKVVVPKFFEVFSFAE